MAFLPLNFEDGKTMYLPCTNTAFSKGDAIKTTSGVGTPAASGDNTDVWFVAAETKTIAASGDPLLVYSTSDVRFIVDSSNTPTQAQMMLAVDLSAAGTVDTSAVTDQVFFAEYAKLPLSSKKIVGYFTRGVPNS
jgi:hypothetical protein